ncbi:MAG: hypothetical protein JOY60_01430 [Burkholderiaceae bacterium]|nr:hypothetical protein [Burkholderiaceae bacterium]
MLTNETSASPDVGMFSLLAAAELQDHLMTVTNDLERLQRLVDDTGEALSNHFFAASGQIQGLIAQFQEQGEDTRQIDCLNAVMAEITGAITALQFQDMVTQLIAHTSQRLRNCSDQLARDTFGSDEDGEAVVEIAPLRPNPVTQDEMDAGSIELF